MVLRLRQIRRPAHGVCRVAFGLAFTGLLLDLGVHVEIVMKAAGIPKNCVRDRWVCQRRACAGDPGVGDGRGGRADGLIAGGVVMMFGGRRGMQMVGTSLGVLLLLGSVTALID